MEINTEKSDKDESGNEEDTLENFMTIDSVGDVDGKFLFLPIMYFVLGFSSTFEFYLKISMLCIKMCIGCRSYCRKKGLLHTIAINIEWHNGIVAIPTFTKFRKILKNSILLKT